MPIVKEAGIEDEDEEEKGVNYCANNSTGGVGETCDVL
jgi:hypothetical protein